MGNGRWPISGTTFLVYFNTCLNPPYTDFHFSESTKLEPISKIVDHVQEKTRATQTDSKLVYPRIHVSMWVFWIGLQQSLWAWDAFLRWVLLYVVVYLSWRPIYITIYFLTIGSVWPYKYNGNGLRHSKWFQNLRKVQGPRWSGMTYLILKN